MNNKKGNYILYNVIIYFSYKHKYNGKLIFKTINFGYCLCDFSPKNNFLRLIGNILLRILL